MRKEDIYKAIEDYKNYKTDGKDATRMIEDAIRTKLFPDEELGRVLQLYWTAMYMQD